ncbi:MAG: bifunctional phosphoribosylaminoimidazolecarboxamide formyltransferase/IMP cyclohydrolase [Nitrospirae bacterium]|nr:bifunctional phosphoribosylaminoimidazolecarboxamide formyltransferase/IMP cyclohydrolase [Nitrospirota bacterium]
MPKALLSVSDKTGLVEFARGLHALGYEILSTGGTARMLRQAGLPITEVGAYTGFPEMMDGRVKTLHPKIHAGILARRDRPDDMAAIQHTGIEPIDLVAVNLYPFEEKVRDGTCPLEDALEEVDIGGPTLVRAAAKNYRHVWVVVDPADYPAVLEQLRTGQDPEPNRWRLARKAFDRVAAYDAAISNEFARRVAGDALPDVWTVQLRKLQALRYGENPHQRGAAYAEVGALGHGPLGGRLLQGKALSFNNLLDAEAGYQLARQFAEPVCVVIKHNNPSGVGVDSNSLLNAYVRARDGDPVSAFGGVVAFNRRVDRATAAEMVKIFTEVVTAPAFETEALVVLRAKKDLRLIETGEGEPARFLDLKRLEGGVLLQDADLVRDDPWTWKVVSKRTPSESEMQALGFGWRVCRMVKSNAIVFASRERTLGIGAGQMSRVDSVRLATSKMREHGLRGEVLVMASDAFFPFRDGLDEAWKAGVTAVAQPGGSVRDAEVIAAADEHGMAMVFTGVRHFRH